MSTINFILAGANIALCLCGAARWATTSSPVYMLGSLAAGSAAGLMVSAIVGVTP